MSLSYFPRPGATFTKLSMMVLVYYVLVVFLCSSNVCLGNIAPGGSNMNPAMYGSYPQQQQQQQQQQQWSSQQDQYQYHDYPQYQQHQQPQQLQQQQQQQVDEPVTADSIIGSNVVVEETILPLPPGWSEHIDPSSGQTYYYNSNDGTTTWDRPKPITVTSGNNETAIPIESSPENDTTTQQHQTLDNPSSSLSNEEFSHMDNRDASAPFENKYQGGDSVNEHHINQEIVIEHDTVTSNNENVLTSVRRDENKIMEDKQWRESQGWTSPSDRLETGTTDTESTTTTNPPPNFEHEPPKLPYQEQQGWGLPAAPQQQSSSGWGISQSSGSDISKTPTFTEQKAPLTAHHSDQQPKDTTPPPFQSEHNKGSEMSPDSTNNAPVDGELKRDYHQPQHSYPHSDDPKQRQNDPRLLPLSHSQVQQVSPPYQRPAPHQQQQYAPSKEYARPAQSTGGTPHQFAQVHQQRPGYPGQPQYPQHQQSSNSNGGNIHSQQQYPYGTGRPGQIPPQHHRLQQTYPNQQQPYQNQQQYQPPPGQSALQQHQPQAGGQLISQEQQNMVKESLGRTWQNILGLKDKTKEVIETTTNTVAQSAREATQTITEKGTGWWGQATKVLGSVFEAEPPSSEYSLSGIYGNIPPIQTQQQEPPRGLPLNPNYPPQYRRPPQQQFPPQGQQHQQPPQQGQYPPSYGPPQPRVDVSYPNEQQGSRQSMPPIQRQLGGNNPQQGYPQQDRPYDTSRQGYQQNFAQQQQRRPPQQQQVKPDDPHTAWSHPGLGSEY